jgi:3'-phosphoadenosine 5'-phosphosulfate sulfotransferase (PAPS reductase)/FAD synthetase
VTDNEFLLFDRLEKIKSVINQYGEDNFYISFSGGKDSCVVSALVDKALPDNRIPRVYANTGIEYNIIRDFVFDIQKKDNRVVIIKPTVPIKTMLERDGYPFKSKHHAQMWSIWNNNHSNLSAIKYRDGLYNFSSNKCPKILKYQFSDDFGIKLSDKCCFRLKEEPLKKWQEENNKPYAILGVMLEEGGRRESAKCLAFKDKGRMNFQPLVVCTKEWEDWYIEHYGVIICDIYKPPYNFTRTGCKGCPFAIDLQHNLDVMQEHFPNERKQCEVIWKPVYDEYRRIGYRLRKKEDYKQMELEDFI